MEYILIKWENEEFWIEMNEDKDGKYAVRQIIVDNTGIHLSCFEDCLSEGVIILSELEGEISKIDSQLFEKKWIENTSKYFCEWEKLKQIYPIGYIFSGKMCYCYPQGIILKNKNVTAVIADYCENIVPGVFVSGEVIGYDNVNLWLELALKRRDDCDHGDGRPRKNSFLMNKH